MGDLDRYEECREQISNIVRQKIDLSREVEDSDRSLAKVYFMQLGN